MDSFFKSDNVNARTTVILLIIVVPSHLFYVLLTACIQNANEFKLTFAFLSLYLTFALVQVMTENLFRCYHL